MSLTLKDQDGLSACHSITVNGLIGSSPYFDQADSWAVLKHNATTLERMQCHVIKITRMYSYERIG